MLSAEQVRAARALLRWEQARLAEGAGVSIETIKRLEKLDGPLGATRSSTLQAIQHAFESAGVEFIAENGGGAGVRLRQCHGATNHLKPVGPATDAVAAMDAAISRDARKPRRRK